MALVHDPVTFIAVPISAQKGGDNDEAKHHGTNFALNRISWCKDSLNLKKTANYDMDKNIVPVTAPKGRETWL